MIVFECVFPCPVGQIFVTRNVFSADFFVSCFCIYLFPLLTTECCNPGYHTLYEWYKSVESEHFPDPTGLKERIEHWTFGLYPACIKYLMSAFDVPEVRILPDESIAL